MTQATAHASVLTYPDAEREAQIRRLLPLVRTLARRVQRVVGPAELDDLVGDGSVGLIRAVDTFDPERGTTIEMYARRLVLGAMLNGLRRIDPVSERVRRTVRRGEARRYELAHETGSLPTYLELEREDPALRRARTAAHRQASLSLDAAMPPGMPDPLTDAASDPARTAERRAGARELAEAVALLPERQRRILAMHYGGEQTLHAIGASMRVSPQRISQLHLAALQRLRRSVVPA